MHHSCSTCIYLHKNWAKGMYLGVYLDLCIWFIFPMFNWGKLNTHQSMQKYFIGVQSGHPSVQASSQIMYKMQDPIKWVKSKQDT